MMKDIQIRIVRTDHAGLAKAEVIQYGNDCFRVQAVAFEPGRSLIKFTRVRYAQAPGIGISRFYVV